MAEELSIGFTTFDSDDHNDDNGGGIPVDNASTSDDDDGPVESPPERDTGNFDKGFLNCQYCHKEMKDPILLPCLDGICRACCRICHEQQRQHQDVLRREFEEREAQSRRYHQEQLLSQVEGNGASRSRSTLTSTPPQCDSANVLSTPSVPSQSALSTMSSDHSSDDDYHTIDGASEFFHCPLDYCSAVVSNVSLDDIEQLNNLNVNLPLQNIERMVSFREELPKGRVKCYYCENDAIGVCHNTDCNNSCPFCAECQRFHLQDGKVHSIASPDAVNLQQRFGVLQAGDSTTSGANPNPSAESKLDWEDLKQSDILCERHGEPMHLYCFDHDEVICSKCQETNTLHRRCDRVESAADLHDDEKGETENKLSKIRTLHHRVTASIKTTKEMIKALTENAEKTKDSIEERFTELMHQLHQQKADLLQKCDMLCNHKKRELTGHLETLRRVARTFVKRITFVNWFKKTAIASEFMMLKTQINHHLDELHETRSNYQYEPIEDDLIYFEKNELFNLPPNAIGKVYSTPSVRNFHIAPSSVPAMVNQPVYFTMAAYDAIRNKLRLSYSFRMQPELLVTLRHIDEDETEANQGCIIRDRKSGKYTLTVYPTRSGEHVLSIYQPMRQPYGNQYVGGIKKYTVNVNPDTLLPNLFQS